VTNRKVHKPLVPIGILALLTLLFLITPVAAQDFPRAIHLSWQNDPATTMTIMWRSELGAEGIVEYGLDSAYGHSVESTTHSYRYGRTQVYWHTAELTGLAANTTYSYRLKTSEPWESEGYTFKTALAQGDNTPFRFAVMSDAQGIYDIQRKAFEMVKEENVDFILYLGDFTDTGNQQEWDIWFGTGEGVLSEIPLMSVLGNHEGDQLTYWEQFALPGHERWYSMDYGNVHFVFLNSNTQAEVARQRPWLLDDLLENNSRWTIAMGHHPMYSGVTSKPEYQFLRDDWLDVMEEYGVDLYFSGHNHCYERTWPIKADQIDSDGIIHVVHGPAGEKFYSVESAWWSNVFMPETSMYSIYSVNGLQIEGGAKSVDGMVVDEFKLEQTP
jgi:predicted phosphodiesterase